MNWSALIEWLVRTPFLALSVAGISVALILNDDFTESLALSNDRRWLSVVFLVSLAIGMAQLTSTTWNFTKKLWLARVTDNRNRNRLLQLTPDEKTFLKCYIDRQTRTQDFDLTSGTIDVLVRAEVISKAETFRDRGTTFWAFTISDWAWDYLNANKGLLAVEPTLESDRQ